MKTTDSPKDPFLSEWIEGRMTDEALRQKVSPDDYAAYLKLRDALAGLSLAEPDLERHYQMVKQKKIDALDAKPKTRPLYVWLGAAAALLLFFGIYRFVTPNVLATGHGQTADMVLADGSEVTLAGQSSLSYPNWFAYRRTLELRGEAYFKVSKGRTFTVQTQQGTVTVLGTRFNVLVLPDYFEVTCFEGKVQVVSGTSQVLEKGQAVRFLGREKENYGTPQSEPAWLHRESIFDSAPLEAVLLQLSRQYNRKILCPDSLKTVRFTGSFTHNDLQTALRSVATPLQKEFKTGTNGILTLE